MTDQTATPMHPETPVPALTKAELKAELKAQREARKKQEAEAKAEARAREKEAKKMKTMETTAPAAAPAPAILPAANEAAPPITISSGPKTKQQRLAELNEAYTKDQVTPADYHRARAAILAEP